MKEERVNGHFALVFVNRFRHRNVAALQNRVEILSDFFPVIVCTELQWCHGTPGVRIDQRTTQTMDRSSETIGQFQCVPDKGGNQSQSNDKERQEATESIAERLAPIGIRLLEQANPNHQRDGIANEEQYPMDGDLAKDAALDFRIDQSFTSFDRGRAGHRYVSYLVVVPRAP